VSGVARRNRGFRNVNRLRQKLRRLPDVIRDPVRKEIEHAAEVIYWEAVSKVPKDTGNLARLLSFKVGRDGLSAKIGLRGKKANRKGFYGKFLEFGTKPNAARMISGGARGGGQRRGSSGMRARPFLLPAFEKHAKYLTPRIARAINQAFRSLSHG